MPTSPARIAANQLNARKSTGPRTDAGKAVSRQNAFKHGLTGAGVVIPGEDHAAIVHLVEGFTAEFALEGSAAAHVFARRAALLAVRGERCLRHEIAMTAERLRHAEADFDEARQTEAVHLLDYIAQDPINNHRRLMAMPEGVDVLLDRMHLLRRSVTGEGGLRWDMICTALFDYSRGERPESGPFSYAHNLRDMILNGDDSNVVDAPTEELSLAAKRQWAVARMVGLIDAEIAKLAAHRPTLDHARIAASRAQAAERALIASDPTSILTRKYEAATERSLQRAMFELRQIRKQHEADQVEDTVETALDMAANIEHMPAELAELNTPLGSFLPGPNSPPLGRDAATITVARLPGRYASRYEDRKQRPKPPR